MAYLAKDVLPRDIHERFELANQRHERRVRDVREEGAASSELSVRRQSELGRELRWKLVEHAHTVEGCR